MFIKKALKQAIAKDPSIYLSEAEIQTSEGFSTEYMESLGLTQAQLKKLARQGKVVRAYKPGVQGLRARWLVIKA